LEVLGAAVFFVVDHHGDKYAAGAYDEVRNWKGCDKHVASECRGGGVN
jgi:hypothetical protein